MTAEKLNEYFEQHPFDSLSKAVFSLLYTAIIQNVLARAPESTCRNCQAN